MPGQEGIYSLKTYFSDEKGNVGYTTFKIKVVNVFVPSMNVQGQGKGSSAMVLKRCVGAQCKDAYIASGNLGADVKTTAK